MANSLSGPEVVIERWRSSENREECHYFFKDADGHETYLFGVNPDMFHPGFVKMLELHFRKKLVLNQATAHDPKSADGS